MHVLTPIRRAVPIPHVSRLRWRFGPAFAAGLFAVAVASSCLAGDSGPPEGAQAIPVAALRALLIDEFQLIEARLDSDTAEHLGRRVAEASSLEALAQAGADLALAASSAAPAPPTTLLPPPSGGELGVAVLRGPTGRVMGSAPKVQRSTILGSRGTRELSRGTWLPSPDSQ